MADTIIPICIFKNTIPPDSVMYCVLMVYTLDLKLKEHYEETVYIHTTGYYYRLKIKKKICKKYYCFAYGNTSYVHNKLPTTH